MDTKSQVTNEADATEACMAAESALLYADGVTRYLTHRTLELLDTAVSTGHPDALLLRAIRYRDMNENAYQYLREAELHGCTQPRLYSIIGVCYYQGNEGVERDEAKAFECFEKATQRIFPFLFVYFLTYSSSLSPRSFTPDLVFSLVHCGLRPLPNSSPLAFPFSYDYSLIFLSSMVSGLGGWPNGDI